MNKVNEVKSALGIALDLQKSQMVCTIAINHMSPDPSRMIDLVNFIDSDASQNATPGQNALIIMTILFLEFPEVLGHTEQALEVFGQNALPTEYLTAGQYLAEAIAEDNAAGFMDLMDVDVDEENDAPVERESGECDFIVKTILDMYEERRLSEMFTLKIMPENDEVLDMYVDHGHFHEGDAGLDLYAMEDLTVEPGETATIHFKVSGEAEKAYFLMPRSSISKTPLRMANSLGLIDGGYRGEIMAKVDNIKTEAYTIQKGDRLFQIVAADCSPIHLELVNELSETTRGTGGFGSTGR